MNNTTFDCARTCKKFELCKFQPLFVLMGVLTQVFSHITKISTVFKDLDALIKAAAKHGLTFHENQTTYKWYGVSVGDYPLPEGITADMLGKCTHALHLNASAYEIGVQLMPDGTYSLLWDFWNGGYGLQGAIGKDGINLVQEYRIQAATNAANQMGWSNMVLTDGSLLIMHPSGGSMTVALDGTVEASNFVGAGCHDAEVIERALGVAIQTDYKPEYYCVPNTIDQY